MHSHTHTLTTWLLDFHLSMRLHSWPQVMIQYLFRTIGDEFDFTALLWYEIWQGVIGWMLCPVESLTYFLTKLYLQGGFAKKKNSYYLILVILTKYCSSVPQLCSQPTTSTCFAGRAEDSSAKTSNPAVKLLKHPFVFPSHLYSFLLVNLISTKVFD